LRDAQATGGVAEMQLLGDGHEVPELAQFHGFDCNACTALLSTFYVLDVSAVPGA
jgi:hypothetical protein